MQLFYHQTPPRTTREIKKIVDALTSGMGKVKSCSIGLTSSSGVYRPGDSVKGVATVDIEGELKVRAINIFCRGQALTKWERFLQKENEKDSESTEIYCNKYINAYTANRKYTLFI